MAEPVRCGRCVFPEGFPGVRLGPDGLCNHCAAAPSVEVMMADRDERLRQLEDVVALRSTAGAYDCIVAFSGGKDSTYTLRMLTERYKLRCLAIMVDNGFISPQARMNGRIVTETLGVDLQVFRPAPGFMRRLYRESALATDLHTKAATTRASGICNSCIGLINNYVLRTALEKQVSVIAGGYIGGQIPKDACVLTVNLDALVASRKETVKRLVRVFGRQAEDHFALDNGLVASSRVREIHLVNPMIAARVGEAQILESIAELGWVRTVDTGQNSSNCQLNDLGIAIHVRRHGFHPYTAEIAEQVRSGLMERDLGLRRLAAIPTTAEVRPQAEKIGLFADEL